MKKNVTLLLVFLSITLMAGCAKEYFYDYTELSSSVKQVYIVEVQRSEFYGDISIEYLKEIKDYDIFLQDLSNLRYEYSSFLEPENNKGKVIMLIYDDADYDFGVVGPNGIEKFKDNKEVYFYNARCDENELSLLINKYFDN